LASAAGFDELNQRTGDATSTPLVSTSSTSEHGTRQPHGWFRRAQPANRTHEINPDTGELHARHPCPPRLRAPPPPLVEPVETSATNRASQPGRPRRSRTRTQPTTRSTGEHGWFRRAQPTNRGRDVHTAGFDEINQRAWHTTAARLVSKGSTSEQEGDTNPDTRDRRSRSPTPSQIASAAPFAG